MLEFVRKISLTGSNSWKVDYINSYRPLIKLSFQ